MEYITQEFENQERITEDTQVQPRRKLVQLLAISVVVFFVLSLLVPQAQENQIAPPEPGAVARAALCGTPTQ